MKISSKGQYAVRVMAQLAESKKEYVSLSEIAEKQNISVKYLEKIMSLLTKAKLLESSMGSLGGYKLAKSPDKCMVSDILSVTGDLPELVPCQKAHCPNQCKCVTMGCWETLSNIIYDYLKSISLLDLVNKTYKKSWQTCFLIL